DVSNTGISRLSKTTPEAVQEKIDAPFKDLAVRIKLLKPEPSEQQKEIGASLLSDFISANGDAFPNANEGIYPITSKSKVYLNSSLVAVAAFKERAVDQKCANANIPTIPDKTLKQQLKDAFTLNIMAPEKFLYSDTATLGNGKRAGNNLADRYCQDRGLLPVRQL
ncbi:hypothetical protein PN473_05280, partial [Dolichospermum circinale CS-545/17]|nr:hypothetical protein [Dolichospermum circinale CS-545/17]